MNLFQVAVRHDLPYLLVQASGPATLPEMCAYMDFVAALASRMRRTRAVMNLMEVEVALSFTDHLQLGAHAAARLAELERVASAVPPRYRTGTSEKAAQKSGLRFRTFTSVEEAAVWVMD